MKRINNQVFIIVCCFMLFSLAASLSEATETQLRKLRVAITSLSGSMAVPWLARDAGIF